MVRLQAAKAVFMFLNLCHKRAVLWNDLMFNFLVTLGFMDKIKNISLMAVIVAGSFVAGYACKITVLKFNSKNMKKVTGIGGIFFRSKDPKAINEWYKQHLGFDTTPYGTTFRWCDAEDSSKKGATQWNAFPEGTKYFAPSTKEFMINYRVENLELLVEELRKEKVIILDKIEDSEYGKFVHILDIEGNKIELWEPKNKD